MNMINNTVFIQARREGKGLLYAMLYGMGYNRLIANHEYRLIAIDEGKGYSRIGLFGTAALVTPQYKKLSLAIFGQALMDTVGYNKWLNGYYTIQKDIHTVYIGDCYDI